MTLWPTAGSRRAVAAAAAAAAAAVAGDAPATHTRVLCRACHTPLPRICRPLSSSAAAAAAAATTATSVRPPLPPRHPQSSSSSSGSPSRLRDALRKARSDYPIMFPALLIGAALSLSLLGLLAWDEYNRVAPAFSAYPTAVEQRLRMALHYTYISPDPDAASKYFREAIEVAEGLGMDPLSKEYIGLRIRYAECLEKYGRVKASIDVLAHLNKDLDEALATVDSNASSNSATASTSSPTVPATTETTTTETTTTETTTPGTTTPGTTTPEKASTETASPEKASTETTSPSTSPAPTRADLLKRIIQNKVKIASLYDSEYMQDRPSAKETLSAAIQLLVSESTPDPVAAAAAAAAAATTTTSTTSSTKGKGTSASPSVFLSAQNAANLSLGEIAAMLSQMGDLYATTGEEANAVQTYMLALPTLRAACDGSRTCKEVQLLSNIAATMYQALKKPNAKINGKPAASNPELVRTARSAILKWADQAIATADRVVNSEQSRQAASKNTNGDNSSSHDNDQDDSQICTLSLLSAQMTKAHLLIESGDNAQASQILSSLLPIVREKGSAPLKQAVEDAFKRATTATTTTTAPATATANATTTRKATSTL